MSMIKKNKAKGEKLTYPLDEDGHFTSWNPSLKTDKSSKTY